MGALGVNIDVATLLFFGGKDGQRLIFTYIAISEFLSVHLQHNSLKFLGLETLQLSKLQASIGRAVRLTWDRALLNGLREARRLLTQGLAFNEKSTFLLLELLKLEGAAADFFANRVAKRRQQATYTKPEEMDVEKADEEEEGEEEADAEPAKKRRRRRFDPAEANKRDATAFVSLTIMYCLRLRMILIKCDYLRPISSIDTY